MNYVSRNLLLQEVFWVFRHRGDIVTIPRNAAIGKYEFHMNYEGKNEYIKNKLDNIAHTI